MEQEYALLYKDNDEVLTLPGTNRPFCLEDYQNMTGRLFHRMTFVLKSDFDVDPEDDQEDSEFQVETAVEMNSLRLQNNNRINLTTTIEIGFKIVFEIGDPLLVDNSDKTDKILKWPKIYVGSIFSYILKKMKTENYCKVKDAVLRQGEEGGVEEEMDV
eukprot:gene11099-19963_t